MLISSSAVAHLEEHMGLCLRFAPKYGPSGQKRTHVSTSSFGFGLRRVWYSSSEATCVCPNVAGRRQGPRGAVALLPFYVTASLDPLASCWGPQAHGAVWQPVHLLGGLCLSHGKAQTRAFSLQPPAPSLTNPNQPRNRSRGRAWPRPTEGVAERGVAFGLPESRPVL